MKALRVVLFGAFLASGIVGLIAIQTPTAHAQAMAAGGGSDACTLQNCVVTSLTASNAGAGVTGPKLTSTATTLNNALVIPAGTYFDLGSGTGNVKIFAATDKTLIVADPKLRANTLEMVRLNFQVGGLPGCDSTKEFSVWADGSSGVATGAVSRICICVSNGASVYTWRNLMSGTNGTASTCPA